MIMQDEVFFIHDTVYSRKYWSPKGRRIKIPCTGSHKKVTIYGSLALDGRQFFRTYDRFNAVIFVAYLKELQKHFGKAVLICNRAPQHHSKLVKEFLRKNKSVRIMYFPKGSPYLNAVEECWRQGKRRLLVSKYYWTFSDMCMAISTYYRTGRFHLELIKYVNKKLINPRELMIASISERALRKFSVYHQILHGNRTTNGARRAKILMSIHAMCEQRV